MMKPACPICKSKKNVRIIYGFPTAEVFAAADAGKIVLGGCILSGDDPTRQCDVCGAQFRPGSPADDPPLT